MAIEKKPSIYSDRSAIGSADELDQYGVWVKSEPQDMVEFRTELPDLPEMEETLSFDSDAAENIGVSLVDLPDLPDPSEFEKPILEDSAVSDNDFSVGLESLENEVPAVPEHDFSLELESLETGAPAADAEVQGASDDISTRLLMKIAEELSSIREELSTLKKEFASIRIGGAEKHDGFFVEDDDEKIALTGDEMDTILNTAALENLDSLDAPGEALGITEEEPLPLEPEAAELEAFIEEAAEQPAIEEAVIEESFIEEAAVEEVSIEESSSEEAAVEQPPEEPDVDEEIEIDLDDLGINLNDIENETQGEASPADMELPPVEVVDELDVSLGSDFDIDVPVDEAPDLEEISASVEALDAVELPDSEETAAEIEMPAENSLDDGIIGLEALDENNELHNIRLEEVEPLTIPPDSTSYLEDDPLAAAPEDISLMETSDEQPFDLSASESSIDDGLVMEDGLEVETSILEEPILENVVLDDDVTIAIEEEEHENLTEGGAVLENVEELAVIPEVMENNTEEIIVPFDDEIDPLADEGLSAALDNSSTDELSIDELSTDELSIDELSTDELSADELEIDETPLPEAELVQPLEPDVSAAALEDVPSAFKKELRNVLSYMDRLLESLPEEKIDEFAKSEYFASYKKLFKELGLV